MKIKAIILISIAALLCGCGKSAPEPTHDVETLLDVQQFAGISEHELIEKMGEPESREEWNYEKYSTVYPIVSCIYDGNRFEFLLNNDKVLRISVYADSYNTENGEPFKFEEKDDILYMFGINPDDVKYAKKTDTNSAIRYENFGNITSLWVPSYEDNSFDEVKIDFSDLFQ